MKDVDRETQEVRSYVRERMSSDLPPKFVEDVMSDVHRTPQRRRGWFGWPIVAGLAAAAAGVAVVGIGLSLINGDEVGVEPTPSASAAPEASASPAPSGIPARPPLSYPPLTDSGSRATVIVDRLEVLDFPVNSAFVTELGEGTQVLLTEGPLSVEGLDWYEVSFSWLPSDPGYFADVTFGWVAAGPTGQPATSISIEPPRCPDSVTANVVGGMSGLARLQCLGTGPHEVTGVIHGCTDYYVGGEPAWLFTECLNLLNLDGTFSNLFIFFPPGIDSAGYAEGDVVRVAGHVDDPAASECRVSNPDPAMAAVEPALQILGCRSAFVVSEIEVTGHLELPQ
jgi:hypothetical protein